MFRHKGKTRTYQHNLRLAAVLSFIAGMVNVCGVLSIKVLTTNVTGHFAYFSEEIVNRQYASAAIFLLYIFSFLLGSFVSNLLIELVAKVQPRVSHAAPMVIEILVLVIIGLFGQRFENIQLIACLLLFIMGIQNSLVTQVSQATVRTTHLTGLFTDLGIELSQLFFYREKEQLQKLSKSIYLRLTIIAFFFCGCVLGGFMFKAYNFKTLLFAAACLLLAVFYDNILYSFYFFRRKLRDQ
jgi:uncharacterized membrane protein YoaK (UPF0700 family)